MILLDGDEFYFLELMYKKHFKFNEKTGKTFFISILYDDILVNAIVMLHVF